MRVVLTHLFVIVYCLTRKEVYSYCRARAYEVPGDVMFTVIMSVRESDGQEVCNSVSYAALQNILAFNYSISKLNQLDSDNQQFIPGVTLGYRILDDCGESNISNAYALDILRSQFPMRVTECFEGNATFFAGVIGASRSSTTKAVASTLRNSEFPIISYGGTLPEFSNKTLFPNLLRTVYSDKQQIKAIISLIESLSWTRFVLIHTDEDYGTSAAHALQQLSKERGICVSLVKALPLNKVTSEDVFSAIEKQESSYGGSIGVVFIGQRAGAEVMVRTARSLMDSQTPSYIDSIVWVFSESVGTNSKFLSEGQPFSNGIFSISLISNEMPEFKTFFEKEMAKQQSSTNPWMKEFTEKNCVDASVDIRCSRFEMNDFVPSTLDAVYALAVAVKDTHRSKCGILQGICDEMKKDNLVKNLMNVEVDYSAMDPKHVPPSFARSMRTIQFDRNGDVLTSKQRPLYQYNMFVDSSFKTVGNYSTQIELDLAGLQSHTNRDGSKGLKRSTCQSGCPECQRNEPFIYIPGDVIVVALVSIHQTSKENPFKCGETRATTNAIPSLEALLHLFNDKLKTFKGQSFGLLVFDDCYSFLRAGQILSSLFSGENILVDERSGDAINVSSIVAVLGPEPSGIAVPIALGLKKIRLPQVSYSASSPDLDDRTLYPYFLRPVPSDKIQAKVMIEIVKEMRWNYIDIIFTNNNYGLKGMQKIADFAALEGVCVGDAFPIDEKPDDKSLAEVIKNLSLKQAKVVLFFGTGESAKALLKAMKNYRDPFTFVASEDWGVNPRTIEGVEEQALGSLIVTLDTSSVVQNNLNKHLLQKFPSENDTNPWFVEYWQEKFKCNLPWSFSKADGRPECQSGARLSKQDVYQLVNDQRIVHTMNSLYAIVSGLVTARHFLCQHVDNARFICDKFRQYPDIVTAKIRETMLFDGSDQFQPFRTDGNGNIGFKIHNLKKKDKDQYLYESVGEYTSYGFRLRQEDITLYNDERRKIKSLSSECTIDCDKCKVVKPAASSGSPTESKGCNSELVATLVITCLLCVLVIVVIVILVTKKRKRQVKYELKDEQYLNKANEKPGLVIQNPTEYTFSEGDGMTYGCLTEKSYGQHQRENGVSNPSFNLGNNDKPQQNREFLNGPISSPEPCSISHSMVQGEAGSTTCPCHSNTQADYINPKSITYSSNLSTSPGSSFRTTGSQEIQTEVKCSHCDGYMV